MKIFPKSAADFWPQNCHFLPIFITQKCQFLAEFWSKLSHFGRFLTLASKNCLQSCKEFYADIWQKLLTEIEVLGFLSLSKGPKLSNFEKFVWEFLTLKKKLSHKNAIKRVEWAKNWVQLGEKWGRFWADFWSLKLPILPIFWKLRADFCSEPVGNTAFAACFCFR